MKKDKNEKNDKAENEREDEYAVTVAEVTEADKAPKEKKESSLKRIMGFIDTAKVAGNSATEFYNHWIKPVYDNRAQIKRRLNAICTSISLIFFIIYIPLLLFGKIANGLSLGNEIALYVCVGVYTVTIVALLIVTLATGNSTSTESAKKRKKVGRIILFIVRIASVAISITALVISEEEGGGELNTLATVVAIISIIFSLLPLVFGSIGGFFRWLISPAKIKRNFAFVALEWNQMTQDADNMTDKNLKRAIKKYGDRVNDCLDKYLLPHMGKKYIKSVDGQLIKRTLECVPEEESNLAEWVIKRIFEYAEECGYVDSNPCAPLELQGDIVLEEKSKRVANASDKNGIFGRVASLFKRKGEQPEPIDVDDEEE